MKKSAQHHALIAMAAFALVLSMAVDETSAQTRQRTRFRVAIPPGAKAQIQGNKATIISRENISGTYECNCTGTGTCELVQGGGTLVCGKGTNSTCDQTCELVTTTTGAAGSGGVRRPPPPTGGVRQ
jgi:hypothetical protein